MPSLWVMIFSSLILIDVVRSELRLQLRLCCSLINTLIWVVQQSKPQCVPTEKQGMSIPFKFDPNVIKSKKYVRDYSKLFECQLSLCEY